MTDPEITSISDILTILDAFDPAVRRRILTYVTSRLSADNPRLAALTPREVEILQELHGGASNKQIAQHLGLSPSTVKNHVHNLLEKLALQRRAQVATVNGSAGE